MKNLYGNEFESRISEMTQESKEQISYNSLLSTHRKSTIMGCSLAVLQQLTGINVIFFYSNLIFSELSMSATSITAMIGIINFIVTCIGLVLLQYFGRRTLMLFGSATMSVTLFLMALFAFS